MDTFNDDLLSVVDRFIGRLGPLASLIDGLIGRIAPQITAQASCPPPSCDNFCFSNCYCCNGNCHTGEHYLVNYYACDCSSGQYIPCTQACGTC